MKKARHCRCINPSTIGSILWLCAVLLSSLPRRTLLIAGDSTAVAYQLQNIGLQLQNIQDFAKANEYFKAALKTLQSLPESYENKLEIFSNTARNAVGNYRSLNFNSSKQISNILVSLKCDARINAPNQVFYSIEWRSDFYLYGI